MKPSIWRTLAFVLILGLAATVLWSVRPSTAALESQVGYLDEDAVIEAYAGTQIAAVVEERDRLQRKFDQESSDLTEDEKRALFQEYEERLKQFERDIGIADRMREIDAAIQAAAEKNGVGVVLDKSVIIYGGIELTQDVLTNLGIGR